MVMNSVPGLKYADVLLPLRLGGEVTYIVPQEIGFENCREGSRVWVEFSSRRYCGVVTAVYTHPPHHDKEVAYKNLLSVGQGFVRPWELRFWKDMADYYLCTAGEVYRAACPSALIRQQEVKSRKSPEQFFEAVRKEEPAGPGVPELSAAQHEAFEKTVQLLETGKKPVLLHGVAGSGKTEIYISLALEELKKGKNVLYMVPEIALSRQLQTRLKKVFGERLLTFHSGRTIAEKKRVHDILSCNYECPAIVLGTRSALFLPYCTLGLVIIDEEHDSSYKQSEPAPRYHARDAAVILAKELGSKIIMGSATPSLESEYNCSLGRFSKVSLLEKYYGPQTSQLVVVDTSAARRLGQMKGSFSQQLINEIKKTLENRKQVLVFKNRRSYSPFVECTGCGNIPKCPRCNVILSYHKYDNTLRCHYCDYQMKFTGTCQKCGGTSFTFPGAGTEKIEEELKSLFPGASVSRFDADITRSRRESENIIRLFSQGATDILVGTQMIGKGFDFGNLELVAILDAQQLFGIQDFRADERAMQQLSQLIGRTGRRGNRGKVLIQTANKEHPVISFLKSLQSGDPSANNFVHSLFMERVEFRFAPYVRMIKLTVKSKTIKKLDSLSNTLSLQLASAHIGEVSGPFVPPIDRLRGEWLKCFYLKLKRDKTLLENKRKIRDIVEGLRGGNSIIIDVDPY